MYVCMYVCMGMYVWQPNFYIMFLGMACMTIVFLYDKHWDHQRCMFLIIFTAWNVFSVTYFFLCIMTWCYLLEKRCWVKSSVVDMCFPARSEHCQHLYCLGSYSHSFCKVITIAWIILITILTLCYVLVCQKRYVTLSFGKMQSSVFNTARGIGRSITNTIIFNLLCR